VSRSCLTTPSAAFLALSSFSPEPVQRAIALHRLLEPHSRWCGPNSNSRVQLVHQRLYERDKQALTAELRRDLEHQISSINLGAPQGELEGKIIQSEQNLASFDALILCDLDSP
jgi:hypothetical protein